jgi:uncharacterized protein with PQ loop repeat
MSVPSDVFVASNFGALLSAFVTIPQIVRGVRRPQTLEAISPLSLLLQVAALVLFTYVNLRLGLLIAALQTASSCGVVLVIVGLRLRHVVRWYAASPLVVSEMTTAVHEEGRQGLRSA